MTIQIPVLGNDQSISLKVGGNTQKDTSIKFGELGYRGPVA